MRFEIRGTGWERSGVWTEIPPFIKRWHLGMVITDYEYDEQRIRYMWAIEYECGSR